ncbi:MAG: hypothetical protein WDN24_04250 [Sphingomonas sp.]
MRSIPPMTFASRHSGTNTAILPGAAAGGGGSAPVRAIRPRRRRSR